MHRKDIKREIRNQLKKKYPMLCVKTRSGGLRVAIYLECYPFGIRQALRNHSQIGHHSGAEILDLVKKNGINDIFYLISNSYSMGNGMGTHDTLLDKSDIERILTRISHEILEKHRGIENLALVGIHTRGVHLARRIGDRMAEIEGAEIPTGEIDITLYRDDWTRIGHHPVVKKTDISFSVDEKHIILVDDVLYTGRTTRAAMDALVDFGRPDRIELAVLVDRGHRELPIQADYVGKHIGTKHSETVNVMLEEHDETDRVVIDRG